MKTTNGMPSLWIVAFIFVLGLTALVTFSAMREVVASWEISTLEQPPFSPQLVSPTPTGASATPEPVFDLAMPLQPSYGPPARSWDGNRPVTILLMGVDAREKVGTGVPPRSDTLILFTFNPETNTASLLSIPRDLWVSIPGFGSGKVNTAYQLGEVYQAFGGGAGLAMRTLEVLLGIPIDYYALVDFTFFARFVDEIGGVKLMVPEPVKVSVIGGKTKTISSGLQTMDGDTTLAYVRARNTPGGDFDRVQRQQLVLMGIRNRVLDFDLLSSLIAKAPLLYGEFSESLRTNLAPNDVFKLAVALKGIPFENISMVAIGQEDVTFGRSPDGTDVLVPIPERIRQLRDEIVILENPLTIIQGSKTLAQLIEEEAARIKVINGTATLGLAAQTTEYLLAEDLNITVTDIADAIYPQTTLIDYTGNPYTVELLVLLLDIKPMNILQAYNPRSGIDIEITLGEDWVLSGVLP